MEQRRADILAAVDRVDQGEGVVLLTDMFGGTPSNLAISLMETGRIEVIAGINLPMLIRILNYPQLGLAEIVAAAFDRLRADR